MATIVGYAKGAAAATQVTVTTTELWPSGSSIIVVSGFRPAGDTDSAHYSITDQSGNNYTRELFTMNTFNGGVAVYARHNIGAGIASGTNIVVKMSDTTSKMSAYVFCVTGLDYTGGSPLDKIAFSPADGVNSPSAATYDSTATSTTATANEFLVGVLMMHINDSTGVVASTDFTALDSAGVASTGNAAGSNAATWVQTRSVTATGTYSSNPTGTTRNYRSGILTYKESGGGGTPPAGNTSNFFFMS